MNKHGYTMVELLAVIVIIGLLFTIATISYTSLINKSNNTVYESYMDAMHEAAITYVIGHPVEDTKEEKVSLNQLISDNKIDYINNPKDNNDKWPGSYIEVKREDKNSVTNYEYNVCLRCNDYNNCKVYIN